MTVLLMLGWGRSGKFCAVFFCNIIASAAARFLELPQCGTLALINIELENQPKRTITKVIKLVRLSLHILSSVHWNH